MLPSRNQILHICALFPCVITVTHLNSHVLKKEQESNGYDDMFMPLRSQNSSRKKRKKVYNVTASSVNLYRKEILFL